MASVQDEPTEAHEAGEPRDPGDGPPLYVIGPPDEMNAILFDAGAHGTGRRPDV